MTVTVALTRPVQAHGQDVSQLTMREPTGKDIRRIGMPMAIGEGGAVTILAEPCARYMVELAAVPPSTIDAMPPADFTSCCMAVMSFFGAAPAPTTS